MKKNILRLGLAFTLALSTFSLQAQYSKTGYFMQSYEYRSYLNPALTPSKGYVSIPALGNANVSYTSNVGIDNFLFPSNDRILTFLHPDVTAGTFLGKLPENSNIAQTFDAKILGVGLYFGRSFFDFGIGVHEDISSNFPKEAFALIKQGMQNGNNTTYDFYNLEANANVYLDISLGGSTDIFDNIRVGGRAKLLLGAAAADLNIRHMKVDMSDQSWTVQSDIVGIYYGKGLDPQFNDKGYVTSLGNFSDFGLSGTGFAFDLGATYNPFEYFTVSVAVTDLGKMYWKKDKTLRFQADGTATYSGISNVTADDLKGDGSEITKKFEEATEDFSKIIQLRETAVEGTTSTSLRTCFNAGLEYGFLQNRLGAGLLYTNTAIAYGDNISDFTISADVRFIKALEFAASCTFSNYGTGFGAALSVYNVLFLAIDGFTFGSTSPQGLPFGESSTNVTLGINIPLNTKSLTKRQTKPLGYFGSLAKK